MDLADINNLDFKNIGNAPLPVKIGIIIFLCIALAAAAFYFDTKDQLTHLEQTEAEEGTLRTKFESKQKKAVNLELYKVQLEKMRKTFGTLIRQLPSETEIPNLIVDISRTGLSSGLEIDLFKPGSETKKDFYSEKPIQLRVKGGYHEFGEFASGVAALPRVVTLHNITLTPGTGDTPMTMAATAKTYRYLDDEE